MTDNAPVSQPTRREVYTDDIRITTAGDYTVPTYSNLARREGEYWSLLSGYWVDGATYVVTNTTPVTFAKVRHNPRCEEEEQAIIAAAYESYHNSR